MNAHLTVQIRPDHEAPAVLSLGRDIDAGPSVAGQALPDRVRLMLVVPAGSRLPKRGARKAETLCGLLAEFEVVDNG